MLVPEQHLLQAFIALARTLHFGRTAKELHLTQSTVSHRLRKLEELVGVALFDRTRRSVVLTPAGEALLPRAIASTRELHKGVVEARRVASGAEGKLVVAHSGAASASGLLDALTRHAKRAPGVRFEVRQASVADQRQGILRGEIDLGCTFLDLPTRLAGFTVGSLPTTMLKAWVASDHPLANRDAVSMSELLGERWLLLSRVAEAGFGDFLTDRGIVSHGTSHPIETDSLDACFELVRGGVGVALVPGAPLPVVGIRGVPIRPSIPTLTRVFWADRASNPVLEQYLTQLELA